MLNVISNREVSEAEWDATVRFLELGGQYFVLNRIEWTDAHIPRTEKPVRFVWRAPFGLCWGMVDKWAKLPRPFVA